jgi:hypothetical protein
MAAWFIFKHDAFFPMLEWEQKYFNDAVAAGNNTVRYDWRAQYGEETTHTEYIVDLVAKAVQCCTWPTKPAMR